MTDPFPVDQQQNKDAEYADPEFLYDFQVLHQTMYQFAPSTTDVFLVFRSLRPELAFEHCEILIHSRGNYKVYLVRPMKPVYLLQIQETEVPPKVREEEWVEDGAIPARGAILVVYN